MNIKKWAASTAALLTSALIILSFSSFYAIAASTGFSDVNETHPNYTAIMDLQFRNVISGYADGTFKPEREVNRVEALKMILLNSYIAIPETGDVSTFKDASSSEWYAPYLSKALTLEIVQGYEDGTFKPTQTVNLVELLKMVILANGIDVAAIDVSAAPFADAYAAEWYSTYVQYAKDKKIIEGDSQNKVYPNQAMSRAKVAEVMYRLNQVISKGLDYYGQVTENNQPAEENNNNTTQGHILNVDIENSAYSPASMTVAVGSTVQWTNIDTAVHTVTSDTSTFESGDLNTNETFTYTFNNTGTFTYHCSHHPSMTGTIIVKPANQVPTI